MIKFESEKYFEDAFFESVRQSRKNPLNGTDVISAMRQVEMGDHGRADILILEAYTGIGPRTRENTYIHLVELKITPLCYQDVAQICRYKDFIIESGLAMSLDVQCGNITCSLVGHRGEITQNLELLSKSCGVDLYHYGINFGGVTFSEFYSFEANPEKMALAEKAICEVLKGA